MRRSLTFIAAGLGMAVVLTGCGDSKTTPAASTSTAANPAPAASLSSAAWVDAYCGALGKIAALDAAPKPNVSPGDLAGAKKTLSDLFASSQDALSDAVDKLGKLPAAPVAAGDKAKSDLVVVLTPAIGVLKDGGAKLAAAPATTESVQAAVTAFQNAGTALDKVTDPLAGLKASPELAPSVTTAPNCKKLPPA
jgi:hypothetical protein